MNVNQLCYQGDCIKIYNPEKKELIATYASYKEAEKATGLSPKVLKNAAHSKTRRYSPLLKKEIAIRLSQLKNITNENKTLSSK